MTIQEEFTEIYQQYIHREGADKFLDYLQNKSDFFTAPASTRFHGSYAGGLAQHSINVYRCLRAYLDRERVQEEYGMHYSDETVALVSLLHERAQNRLLQGRNPERQGRKRRLAEGAHL